MSGTHADVVVVGLGAAGSAALLALARAGVRVIGIDRYAPPHDRGSSHGETRVIREATGEGAEFVPLVQRSQALWRDVAAETGVELFRRCGFLAVDATGGAAQRHGRTGFFETTVAVARQCGIPFELPDATTVRARFPAFLLEGGERLFFEPGAGILFPERVIETQLALARRAGAETMLDETVTSIASTIDGIEVRTRAGAYHAARAIVTAGAGTPDLVPAYRSRLRLLRQTLHWFPPATPWFDEAHFPTFLWLYGPRPENSFYGFPQLNSGTQAVKLSGEQFEIETAAWDILDRVVTPAESAALHAHTRGRLDQLRKYPVKTASCVYTHTQDGRFLTEFVDEHERLLLVSACSGHGFKHSAAIGEQAAFQVTMCVTRGPLQVN